MPSMLLDRGALAALVWTFACAACSGNAPGSVSMGQSAGAAAIAAAPAATTAPQSSAQPATTPVPTSMPTQAATPTPTQRSMPAPSEPAPAREPAPAKPSQDPAPAMLGVPCNVKKSVGTACGNCHGTTPIGGAPMALVTAEDFQKPAVTQPTMKVYQLALLRMKDQAKPMPPGAAISAGDKSAIIDWLSAGAIAEHEAGACDAGTVVTSQRSGPQGLTQRPGETCYSFQSHNGMTVDDKTPYEVRANEHYEQFYFKVPWPADSVATRFGGKLDQEQVLHHWLLFSTGRSSSLEGTHEGSSGSQLGDDSQLLAGWALGGNDIEFPPDMGLTLPSSGMLNASWHYYNRTGAPVKDASAVQVCVVNKAMREKILSLSWLGTESFGGLAGMPPHQRSDYSGTCQNRSGKPITIWGFLPHMHQLGRHMKSVVTRADGMKETIFDKPFDFNMQIHYPLQPMIVLQPGDRITSTCTFDNTTDSSVPYGPSSNQEMCYQFTFSYPAGALDNHVFSLTGDKNTCWGD